MVSSFARNAARASLAGLFVFFWLFAAPQRRAGAEDEKKTVAHKPFVFKSALSSGKKAGSLVLGQTTFDEAVKMYPSPPVKDFDGALRPVEEPLPEIMQSVKYVYNPWQTMYALFFDEKKRLVMVSELFELGTLSEKELLKRFPSMVATDTESGSVEYQAEIDECAVVIATVETAGRTVEQLSYAYSCE